LHNRLSFMTFMCPRWSLEQVVEGAKRCGYAGVEPRVKADHAHGIEVTTAKPERARIRRLFDQAGIAISCVATSCKFASGLPEGRQHNLDDARRHLELAAEVGASRIRVFCGNPPEGWEAERVVEAVAEQLSTLAPEAASCGVTVCLETHDYFSRATLVGKALQQVTSAAIAANWDVQHPYNRGEHPLTSWEYLQGRVAHTHVHDFRPNDGKLVEVGTGIAPVRQFLALLRGAGYEGFLSAEYWEELGPPEQALPSYAQGMRRLCAQVEAWG